MKLIRTIILLACGLALSSMTVATPAWVNPQSIAEGGYRVESQRCGLQLDVKPSIGGRITGLHMNGHTVVTPYACKTKPYDSRAACNGSGSTFWTSPQRAWPAGAWPPVVSLDGAAYSATVAGTHLLMSSPENDALGASVDKDIAVDESNCTIYLIYTLKASRDVSLAPWEITRVPRGGIAVFPIGSKSDLSPGPLLPQISFSNNDSLVWFDDSAIPTISSKGGSKLIADAREGWLAYVRDGLVFIKQFDDVLANSIAPNEGDVEVYAGTDYLELEVQGRYAAMKKQDQQPWRVTWRVVKIPNSVSVAVGSPSLLKFIQQQTSLK